MKSSAVGDCISKVEVTNVSSQGIWLLVKQREFFISYEMVPGFKDARIADILNVSIEHDEYLFWPSLGIDLELDSIENPEQYPLQYK